MSTSRVVAVRGTLQPSQAAAAATAQRLSIAMPDARNEEDEQNAIGETLGAVADTLQQNNQAQSECRALAGISRSVLCCHGNETRAPIANPPNSAKPEGTPTIPLS